MIVQDKKLISSARVKIITSYGLHMCETFEQRINDFIKDKNIYDIQYIVDNDGHEHAMVVYQVVGSGKADEFKPFGIEK